VGKQYIDPNSRPALLQGQTGFEFYDRNSDPDDIAGDSEFFDRGEAADIRYWQKLKALVAHLLKRKPAPPPAAIYPPSGRTIYVAKPASDMRAGYDRIVSELAGRGHTVVPRPLEDIPLKSAVSVIDEALSGAEISIHLLGEKAGDAPEDELPMVRLQLARAAAQAGKDGSGKFHRLVWAPGLWSVQPNAGQPAQETVRHPVDVLAKFDRQLPTDKVEGDSLSKFVELPPTAPRGHCAAALAFRVAGRQGQRHIALSLSLPGGQRLRVQPGAGVAAAAARGVASGVRRSGCRHQEF